MCLKSCSKQSSPLALITLVLQPLQSALEFHFDLNFLNNQFRFSFYAVNGDWMPLFQHILRTTPYRLTTHASLPSANSSCGKFPAEIHSRWATIHEESNSLIALPMADNASIIRKFPNKRECVAVCLRRRRRQLIVNNVIFDAKCLMHIKRAEMGDISIHHM